MCIGGVCALVCVHVGDVCLGLCMLMMCVCWCVCVFICVHVGDVFACWYVCVLVVCVHVGGICVWWCVS